MKKMLLSVVAILLVFSIFYIAFSSNESAKYLNYPLMVLLGMVLVSLFDNEEVVENTNQIKK